MNNLNQLIKNLNKPINSDSPNPVENPNNQDESNTQYNNIIPNSTSERANSQIEQQFRSSNPMEQPIQGSDFMTNQGIIQKYQISSFLAQKLPILQNYIVVFILDDSGSMNIQSSGIPGYNQAITRWDELKYFTKTAIEIVSTYSQNGCDAFFLNRAPVKNIRDFNQLIESFYNRPNGVTPLTKAVQTILQDNPAQSLHGKNLLIIILTDGEPTDLNGKVSIQEFKNSLLSRPPNVYTGIVACTNDLSAVAYLNNLDIEIPRLDVVDDYNSEMAEVQKSRGAEFPFSFGDYIVKALLGSIVPEIDQMDE